MIKKSEASKCQLFLALLKYRNMETVRINLGITTMKNIESSNQIVKYLAAAFTSIGKKTRSQDWNVTHYVLAKCTSQDNIVYLNARHKLCLYIQRHLKIFSKNRHP